MRVTRTSNESAFTIVEVLVAALIVTIVFSGAIYFVAGGGKAQQRTLVRQKMAAAADDISQRVRADQQWLKANPSCREAACDVSSLFPVATTKPNDPKMVSTVGILPIDGEGDGLDGADQDHVTPDFYRIQIGIRLKDQAEVEKWGVDKPFETVSTVDATALGLATGALVVQTCETANQVDERMSVAGCEAGGGGVLRDMHAQPSPCASPFPIAFAEWATGKRPALPLGCNDAFNAAGSKSNYLAGVHLRAVTDVGFKIQRVNTDGGPSTVRLHTNADEPPANGTYVFTGLPAGVYKITANPGPGRELWHTKMVPSAGEASVQGNQEARALVTVRPRQGLGEYGARFTRATWHYWLETYSKEESEQFNAAGMTVLVTTTYRYLIAKGPKRIVWDGPAWSGVLAMEPKPYDRYRDGSNSITQPAMPVMWDDDEAPNNGWVRFTALPTGLATLPMQQPAPDPAPGDTWGDFGKRTHDCNPSNVPGNSCGKFAWLDHRPGRLGDAEGSVSFHSEDGECYLSSGVPNFTFGRKLQNGGGHADRCSRDFHYKNPKTGKVTIIPNFLPKKDGSDGGQMLISMSQTTECIANCEYTSGGGTVDHGYADPGTGNVGSAGSPPPRQAASPPPITKNPPPKTGTSGGSGGGGGGGTFPSAGQTAPSAGGGSGGSSPLSGVFGDG